MHEGFDFVLRHVYSPDYVYRRALTFLKAYPGPKVQNRIVRKFSARDLGTFFRILIRLGVLDASRGRFWSLFFWTLRNRRNLAEYPFFFAALSLQFQRMYERYDAAAETRKMQIKVVEMPVAGSVEAPAGMAKSA